MKAGAQLTFSFVSSPQLRGWCRPHSGCIFLPQGSLPQIILTEVHLLVKSKSRKTDDEDEPSNGPVTTT